MQRNFRLKLAVLVTTLYFLVPIARGGQMSGGGEETPDLFELSLEELLDIEVTSVAKKPQPLSEAAAAIFVITQEDIRRSGVKTIPDALRMSPGVEVAQIDSNKWAVSIRGFNGRFANKLLVMIDGRTVYSPSFSGVFWDVQDLMLEDVDRIEIIRGPGATLWGANAVNGVINIITKSADDTQGGLFSAGGGNVETGFGSLRYGGELNDRARYRIYGKYFKRADYTNAASDESAGDDWQIGRLGFRVDWDQSNRDDIMLQGSIYSGDAGSAFQQSSLTPPFSQTANDYDDVSGGSVLTRWNRQLSGAANLSLQLYYERTSRDGPLFIGTRDTIDVEMVNRFSPVSHHDLLWGLGYRYTTDQFGDTFPIQMNPTSRGTDLFSAFIQDEIELYRLRLTVGAKFEYNDYSGFEVQPNVRLLWAIDDRQSLWGSIARAVRTPSRGDHDVRLTRVVRTAEAGIFPNLTRVPVINTILGNHDFDSEELIAYELGYRIRATNTLRVDVATFYNDYDKLRSGQTGAQVCRPSATQSMPCPQGTSFVQVPTLIVNDGDGDTWGLEVATDWTPRSWLRLKAAYTYLNMNTDPSADSDSGENPENKFSLRSWFDVRHDTTLDFWLRYVDELPSIDVPSYVELDARLAWRPRNNLELSLVGRNLLQSEHVEFVSTIVDQPRIEIPRSFYGQVRWWF